MAQRNSKQNKAAEEYALRMGNALNLRSQLESAILNHSKRQLASPKHYGFAGDMAEVEKHLALALAALGDQSAVKALGLEY
jgi:hypothetical protein